MKFGCMYMEKLLVYEQIDAYVKSAHVCIYIVCVPMGVFMFVSICV